MADHLQDQAGEAKRPNPWVLIALVGVVAYFAVPAYFNHRQKTAEGEMLKRMQADSSKAAQLEVVEQERQQRALAERGREEQVAVAKAVALSMLEEVEQCRTLLVELATVEQNWAELRERVEQTEVGYAIAADESLLVRVEQLLARSETLGLIPADRLQNKLRLLATPLESASSNPQPGYTVNETLASGIRVLARQAKEALTVLKQSLIELRGVAARAEQSAAGEQSLAAALIERKEQRQRSEIRAAELRTAERDEKNARLIEEAEATEDAKLVQKRIDAARAKRKLEESKLDRQMKQDQVELEALLAKQEGDRKRARLEADFQADLAKIKVTLGPYLNAGRKLRGPNPPAEPGPASYSILAGMNATDPGEKGMVGVIRSLRPGFNDRSPHEWANNWQYQQVNRWEYVNLQPVREVHTLLMKYGKLLVEKEMLLP